MSKQNGNVKRAIDKSLRRDLDSIIHRSRDLLSEPAQRYLHAVVDPKRAPPAKCISPSGGYPGQTAAVKLKALVTATTQSATGFGFIAVNGGTNGQEGNGMLVNGPYTDSSLYSFTDSAPSTPPFSGTSTLPTSVSAGFSFGTWSDARFPMSTPESQMSWRLVSIAVYICNLTQLLNQGGKLYLLETSNHSYDSSMDVNKIIGFKRTRGHVAVGINDHDELVLNWHPRMYSTQAASTTINDFQFRSRGGIGGSAVLPQGPLVVILRAPTGVFMTVEAEIYGIYELRGTAVRGKSPGVVDSRGSDLIFNMFATKTLSGYSGNPTHARHAYMASAWKWAKIIGSEAHKVLKATEKGGVSAGAARAVDSFVEEFFGDENESDQG